MRGSVQPMPPHKAWTEQVSDFNDSIFFFFDPTKSQVPDEKLFS